MNDLIRKFKLVLIYYRGFWILSFIITLWCMYMIYTYGLSAVSNAFWVKVISLGLIFLYQREYKSRNMYYYLNLGVSKSFIWSSIVSLEFIVFISLTIIINYLR
ncbi:hypothetical protein Q787_00265 [Ornithobacterium rhinotracheale H06-030791]|uniref:Uncharacterized protein n=1 Tax=Ornithobacterium rhinotracheale (strain ATCC 51463 / DSM 15997 / CCUG 23171 / CIP 104009 / LMG 9086) TaxID=867902 RepID=I3ZX50_ORNRL|nr:hypothetical protein Ornrh_0053 [Ornithobacterium rhinotracheale DSM 15997]AIQ00233.1 hypothetical protein Q785_00265 [Ornithobacterium rhinotracheale ORT-UMN 88]KGB67946.1 hypothetical protein Q787_00265 [Ornithobacterium rhinotracheale H06-030791]